MTEVAPALFRDFAELEARGVSPLYERLARYVGTRPPLRRMLGGAPPRQRRATLFFALVEVDFEGDVRVIPRALPVVGDRIGLDADPVDLEDPGQRRWLRACVWADEADRLRRLQLAIERARSNPPSVLRGDAVADFDTVAALLPTDLPLVVAHQVVMGYLSTRARAQFRRKILDLARHRPVYWLFAESPSAVETIAGLVAPPWDGHVQHTLVLVDLTREPPRSVVLAAADPHGRWLRWVGPANADDAIQVFARRR